MNIARSAYNLFAMFVSMFTNLYLGNIYYLHPNPRYI